MFSKFDYVEHPEQLITTGNSLFAVRLKLCHAHFFKCATKRCFAVRLSHGARRKTANQTNSFACVFHFAHDEYFSPPDITPAYNR
jgi:hypothetical protein